MLDTTSTIRPAVMAVTPATALVDDGADGDRPGGDRGAAGSGGQLRSGHRAQARQRRLSGIDQIVLSLTARGLTTGEVAAHFAEAKTSPTKDARGGCSSTRNSAFDMAGENDTGTPVCDAIGLDEVPQRRPAAWWRRRRRVPNAGSRRPGWRLGVDRAHGDARGAAIAPGRIRMGSRPRALQTSAAGGPSSWRLVGNAE